MCTPFPRRSAPLVPTITLSLTRSRAPWPGRWRRASPGRWCCTARAPHVVHEDPGAFLRLARPRVADREAAHGDVVGRDLEDGVRATAIEDGPRFTLERDPRAIDDDASLAIRPAPDEDACAGCRVAHGVAYVAHGARRRDLDRRAGRRSSGWSLLSPREAGEGGRREEHGADRCPQLSPPRRHSSRARGRVNGRSTESGGGSRRAS